MKGKKSVLSYIPHKIKIKVLGIGGSGCNTIDRMSVNKTKGVDLIILNTDIQDIEKVNADKKIQIGAEITKGFGAGMDIEVGRKSAEESKNEIKKVIQDTDLIFLAGGFGGGTSTGALPVVAKISRELKIPTIAVVTLPFSFEGKHRRKIAERGIENLKNNVDSLILIENDKLLEALDSKITINNAFQECDNILKQAVNSISDLILSPGIVNIDFADIKSLIKDAGTSLFGIGYASGDNRAEEAALQASNSPLLESSLENAKGVIFNVAGNKGDVKLSEVNKIAEIITEEADPDASIIFGTTYDPSLKKGEIKVTVIATGF